MERRIAVSVFVYFENHYCSRFVKQTDRQIDSLIDLQLHSDDPSRE